ncbi:MAG: thiamine-monophosphate kinase [Planctomycetes bacterium]|nr:thiamine-monophosphate kinase [Planctomycetota bacterium]
MSKRRKDTGFSERRLLDWIRKRSPAAGEVVQIGPGDDAALVKLPSSRLLVAIDTIAEGVDFDLAEATAAAVGRKALAINLSDMAAMGASGLFCLASVNLRDDLPGRFARGLYSGMEAMAAKFGCPIVGGDVTGWPGGIVVTVAIAGVPEGKRAVTRAGARPGEKVFVTGTLGGSILGKHLRFTPRVAEGTWLARHCAPTAMIDISDGLGVDAGDIARESGVSLVLGAAGIPISRAARRLGAADGKTALAHAVGDGEDFELLFTLPAARADKCVDEWPFRTKLSEIGTVQKGKGVRLHHRDARVEGIDTEGYEHLKRNSR